MSLLSRLTEKSWEGPGADALDPATYRPPAARVAVIVYFGVITVLFGLVSKHGRSGAIASAHHR